jgi:hypothetical protein
MIISIDDATVSIIVGNEEKRYKRVKVKKNG